MATLYKVELYLCDVHDEFHAKDDALEYLNSLLEMDDYFLTRIINAKESKEFEWYDNIDINYSDCNIEKFEKYFE